MTDLIDLNQVKDGQTLVWNSKTQTFIGTDFLSPTKQYSNPSWLKTLASSKVVGLTSTNQQNTYFDGLLPINRGGTGAATAQLARLNLGIQIGVNVQSYSEKLTNFSGLSNSLGILKNDGSGSLSWTNSINDILAGDLITPGSIYAAQDSYIGFSDKTVLSSSSDGSLELSNATYDGFDYLAFGGSGSTHPRLYRGGNHILEQRHGTSAQTRRNYRTYTDVDNNAYLEESWSGNDVLIKTVGNGSTAGNLCFQSTNNYFDPDGNFNMIGPSLSGSENGTLISINQNWNTSGEAKLIRLEIDFNTSPSANSSFIECVSDPFIGGNTYFRVLRNTSIQWDSPSSFPQLSTTMDINSIDTNGHTYTMNITGTFLGFPTQYGRLIITSSLGSFEISPLAAGVAFSLNNGLLVLNSRTNDSTKPAFKVGSKHLEIVKGDDSGLFRGLKVDEIVADDVLVGADSIDSTAMIRVAAGTADRAQIFLTSSTAPSVPADGEIWFDGTDLKMRIGGITKTFTLT